MKQPAPSTELPPTAGLPLRLRDFLPGGEPLGEVLPRLFDTPPMQLECSGTTSLWLALRVLQQLHPTRHAVVVPAYTCPLVAIAAHALGLQVRVCDLRADHWDMDPEQLASLCDAGTLAVIPTHLGGRVADVRTACDIAHRAGAMVIEDAAQALGAFSQGRSVGLQGDIAFFSLAAGKGLSLYEGGLLLTRDPALRQLLLLASRQEIGSHWGWELRRTLELLGLAACYRPRLLSLAYGNGLRSALAAGQPEQAVGDVFPLQFPRHRVSRWRQNIGSRAARRLPPFLHAGRIRAKYWISRLCHLPGLQVMQDGHGDEGVWPVLMLLFDLPEHRDAVLQRLWTQGLGVSCMFIHALPDYDYLHPILGQAQAPNARDFAKRMLTIGNSPWLDQGRFNLILDVLRDVLGPDH